MAREIQVAPGEVVIAAYQADDGVGVFMDGHEILHVDFLQSGRTSFHLAAGQSADLRFEIYNVTGFNYNAGIVVNAGNRRVYEAHPRGFTPPGWNIAWNDGFTLVAR
jgi:hypothetical protein